MKSLASIINRWQAFFFAFVFFVVAPFAARAQEALKPEDAKTYSDLLKRAKLAANNNKIAEAIALWMQAWNIQQHWHLPCYIGAGHFALQVPDKAATYLTRCLKLAPYPTTPEGAEHRRREREMLEAALDHVAAVLVTAPQGARVTVDTEERGTAPLSEEVFLMPGEHRFIAELNGRTVSRTLTTERRERHNIDLGFPDDKADPGQAKPIETKPNPNKATEKKPIQSARDLPIASNSLPSSWVPRWVPTIALFGASAGLASAGLLMRASAEEHKRDARDIAAARKVAATAGNHEECGTLTLSFEQERADYHRMFYGSLFSFGAAGALGIAGLVYPWLPIHGKSTSIAVSNSSVLIRGSF